MAHNIYINVLFIYLFYFRVNFNLDIYLNVLSKYNAFCSHTSNSLQTVEVYLFKSWCLRFIGRLLRWICVTKETRVMLQDKRDGVDWQQEIRATRRPQRSPRNPGHSYESKAEERLGSIQEA